MHWVKGKKNPKKEKAIMIKRESMRWKIIAPREDKDIQDNDLYCGWFLDFRMSGLLCLLQGGSGGHRFNIFLSYKSLLMMDYMRCCRYFLNNL